MKGLLFTYLLTYGGAVASLFNPFLGLLIYVCFAIIRPEFLWHWSVPQGNYSRIVAVALLVGWALHGFGRWRFGRATAIVTAMIFFWSWTILGALQAPNQQFAWHYVEALSKIFVPFLVGITTVRSVDQLKQLAWVIVLSHGYLALDVNQSYLNGNNYVRTYGFAGMDNNSFAIALVTCFGLAFFLGMDSPKWWQKAAAFGCTALIGHAILLTFSRGGMTGLIVTGTVSFILIPKRPKHYAIFALSLLLALRLAGPEVIERFLTSFSGQESRDYSAESRLELWKACWQTMLKHPATGIGPDHFPLVAHEFGFTRGKEAHSLWMQTGAELGIPGLLSLLSFYVICILRVWPYTRENRPVADPWYRHSARMVIASLSGFLISAQFVSLEGLEVPYYVVLLGAGALKLTSTADAGEAWAIAPDQFVETEPDAGHADEPSYSYRTT